MNAIHAAVKANLDTKTYTNSVNINAYSTSNNINGGVSGNNIAGDGTTYRYARKVVNTENGKILMFPFIGEDNDAVLPTGSVDRYEYDIASKTFSPVINRIFNAATVVFPTGYPVTNWIIHDHSVYLVNGQLRMYFSANNRDSYASNVSALFMIKSTDGVAGLTWTDPVEVGPYHTDGIPTMGGLIPSGTPGISWLMVVGDTTTSARSCYCINIDDATGLRISEGPMIKATAPFTIGEGEFVRCDANRVVGIIRNNAGSGLYMMTTTDNFATQGTLTLMKDTSLNTIGAATGAKVTPKIMLCLNNPNRIIIYFNDRGDSSRTKLSGATIDNAFANVWDTPTYLGTIGNQGNASFEAIDVKTQTYLCATSLQKTNATGIPSAHYTGLIWWIWQDLYTKSISPVPYQ